MWYDGLVAVRRSLKPAELSCVRRLCHCGGVEGMGPGDSRLSSAVREASVPSCGELKA